MSDEYDIIIIGGGSAGCVLANRLSAKHDCSVLLLEAGRSDKHIYSKIPAASPLAITNPQFNWMYEIEPDTSRNGRVDMWPAGRCLGGGSAINGMMFIRSHPYDFNHWAELGNSGWAYEDVLPYFKRMEHNERGADDYRGVDGPQHVSEVRCHIPVTDAWIKALEEQGINRNVDLNGALPEGVDYCQVSQQRGLRHSTGHAYIWPIKKRSNLSVQLHAYVNRIVMQDGKAKAVEYSQQGQEKQATARKAIVLSAGAIASPRLLMLSGIGPGEHLQKNGVNVVNDLPGVGKNLQEHAAVDLSIQINSHTLGSDRGIFRNIVHGINFLIRRRGPLTTPIGHAHAFVKTTPDLDAPNIQVILTPFNFAAENNKIKVSKEQSMGFAIGLMRPRSRGQILLASAKAAQKPVIQHQMFAEKGDIDELIEGFRLARSVLQQESFKAFFVNEIAPGEAITADAELEQYIRETAFPMYHPIGTCKMGQDNMAVVNNKLKVHGTDNLWVVDASVMPTLPSGNTNATAIMIGEKGSDLISAEMR